ncbi:hypothetical protein CPB86DRAFT_99569 [Serendipita vermifera]|nr:hypothetical protein CPB86DRAFT_99569 [Serendipita vermifera]
MYKGLQELLRELENFSQVLSKIETCKGHRMTPMAERCLKTVQVQADMAAQVITEFLEKRQTSTGVWSKVVWAANGSSDMIELRRKLSAHRETLNFLLEILVSQQLSDVMATLEENIKDIHTIARQCPKKLTLVDAIGNYREIPFEFCITYELFTDILRAYFKHQQLPGRQLVDRGDYEILSGNGRQPIGPLKWSTSIFPNITVEMRMKIRRLSCIQPHCSRCRKVTGSLGDQRGNRQVFRC